MSNCEACKDDATCFLCEKGHTISDDKKTCTANDLKTYDKSLACAKNKYRDAAGMC